MPDEDLAWSQVTKKYRDFLSSTGYSKSSVKNYISDLNHLVSWLNGLYDGGSSPLHITQSNLRNYKGYVRHLYRAKPSISSRRISSLRTFLSWAKGEGLVEIEKVRTLSPVLRDPDETGIVEQFRNYLKVSDYSVPTVKNYVVDLRHLISWIKRNYEKFALSAINEHTVRSYRSHLKERFRAKPSISSRRLSSLKKFLIWANKNGLVTEDLVTLAKKVIEEPEPKIVSPTPVVAPSQPTPTTPTLTTPVIPTSKIQHPIPTTPPPTDLSAYKLHQKIIHHIRHTRPSWYDRYHKLNWSDAIHYSVLAGYVLIAGFFLFYTFILKPGLDTTKDDLSHQLAQIGDVLAATSPPSVLSFQGRLTDSTDVPVSTSKDLVFRIYTAETGGTLLWTSKTWGVTPDQNGIFSVCLGNQTTTDDCLINGVADTAFPATLFTDNSALYLEVQVAGETLSPRQRISSVSYAMNSDSLDGVDSTAFLRSDESDSFTLGTLTTDAGTTLDVNGTLAWGGATISETLYMANNVIENIGVAGTDFSGTGGLTLAGNLVSNANTTLGNAASDTMTVNAASTFNTDVDFVFNDITASNTENFNISSSSLKGGTMPDHDLASIKFRQFDTANTTQRTLFLQAQDGGGTNSWNDASDALLGIVALGYNDGSDNTLTYANGILISTDLDGSGDTLVITDAIDVSDSAITYSINIGSNPIYAGGASGLTANCAASEFLQDPTVAGGIVTAGSCASAGAGSFSGEIDDTTNDALSFTTDDATPPTLVRSIYADDTNSLIINSVSGGNVAIEINDANEFTFDASEFNIGGNNIASTASFTLDLVNGSDATLTIDNSGAGDPAVDLQGRLDVGNLASTYGNQALIDVNGQVNNAGGACPIVSFGGCVGIFSNPTAHITGSGWLSGVSSRPGVDGSGTVTLTDAIGFLASDPFEGTSDSITNVYGVYISNLTAGTYNYGICFDCDGTYNPTDVAGGIQWGTDGGGVNLYRSGSNVLETDGTLTVGSNLNVEGTVIGFDNDASANNVLQFSAAAGIASHDLYWGNDLLCDVSETNCSAGGIFSGEVDDTTNDALTFTTDDASPPTAVRSIYADDTSSLIINSVTGGLIALEINDAQEFAFSLTGLEFNSNNITGIGNVTGAGAVVVASAGAGALILDSDSGSLTFGAGTNTLINADAATALLINPTGDLQFQSSSNSITSAGNLTLAGTLTVNGALAVIGSGGNTFTFNTSTGPDYAGTARPTKTITLSPEYAGAVLTAYYGAGTDTSITGNMTSDTDTSQGTSIRNYYEWNSSETAAQNYYTVAVRITLPKDFSAWAATNALVINYITNSATTTQSDLDVRVYNENSSTIVASDLDNSSVTWTTAVIDDSTLDDGVSSEWDAADEVAVIYLRMGSQDDDFVHVGDITLNYLAKF